MRRLVGLAILALTLAPAAEAAPQRWTFCVAASGDGREVWISEVFSAEGARERFETAFKSAIAKLGSSGADAQCPLPREDRTVAMNAQIDAEAFNRKMGASLHAVPASDFPGKR
jgi:hypothetical protein